MLEKFYEISIFNKIFNVHGNEWPKILVSWMIRFLHRAGFVIGWTVMVGLVVSNYGILFLPHLFVLNAVFTIIGSLLYSVLIEKIEKTLLMLCTIFMSGMLLVIAVQVADNLVLFLSLLVVAQAVFLFQFQIMLAAIVEELFTPLQSERTFPLIESADTIAGIVAGTIVLSFAEMVEAYAFVYLWIAFLFTAVPFVFLYERYKISVASFKKAVPSKTKKSESAGVFDKIKKEYRNCKSRSFIKGLFLIVLLQWLLFNLLEFQYTKAVYQNVSNVVLQAGSGFEHVFIHDLGMLFVFFGTSALIVQLFIGSRLINYLGVVGSMLLHPVVTFFSIIWMTLSFQFLPAVLVKNNFTISTIIYTNAYHSTYYAVKAKLREHTREFLEGVVRPIGAILGTGVVIFLQKVFVGDDLVFYVNVSMLLAVIVLFLVIFSQQKLYTKVALDDLCSSSSKKVRFNAIDILSQKGHTHALSVLINVVLDKRESVAIRVKVLRAFAELKDLRTIDTILECLRSSEFAIREAALEVLDSFDLKSGVKKNRVFEYKLVESLKSLYKSDKSRELRAKIISLLSKLSTVGTIEFLLNVLTKSRGDLKSEAIYAMGNFNDDIITSFIKPYLSSKNLSQRVNAAIALARFAPLNSDSMYVVYSLLHSDDVKKISQALFAVGELGLDEQKGLCFKYLKHKDENLRMQAAIALAKLGDSDAIPVLVDLLFEQGSQSSEKVQAVLRSSEDRVIKNLKKVVHALVSIEIEKLLSKHGGKSIRDIGKKNLTTLRWLYSIIDEYDEVEYINSII